MKRREIETRVRTAKAEFTERVERSPVAGFLVGIFVGVILTLTRGFTVPILLVGGVLCWVLWLLGDQDEREEKEAILPAGTDEKPLSPSAGIAGPAPQTAAGSSPVEEPRTEKGGAIKDYQSPDTYIPLKPEKPAKSVSKSTSGKKPSSASNGKKAAENSRSADESSLEKNENASRKSEAKAKPSTKTGKSTKKSDSKSTSSKPKS